MYHFEYVPKKEYMPIKKDLISLINLVQKEVKEYFTFSFEFIGSASRNMITRDRNSNVGYDFDVNIRVNDSQNKYSAKQIKQILKNGFDKHAKKFNYDFSEDSKRVITIKVKDIQNSRILHSCDFAVVNDYQDNNGYERQEYIHFNKEHNSYSWQEQPNTFYELPEKIDWIKENGYWQLVRDKYLHNKNVNLDGNKKSRSIFAETINQVYNEYFNVSDEYYDHDYDEDEDYY